MTSKLEQPTTGYMSKQTIHFFQRGSNPNAARLDEEHRTAISSSKQEAHRSILCAMLCLQLRQPQSTTGNISATKKNSTNASAGELTTSLGSGPAQTCTFPPRSIRLPPSAEFHTTRAAISTQVVRDQGSGIISYLLMFLQHSFEAIHCGVQLHILIIQRGLALLEVPHLFRHEFQRVARLLQTTQKFAPSAFGPQRINTNTARSQQLGKRKTRSAPTFPSNSRSPPH